MIHKEAWYREATEEEEILREIRILGLHDHEKVPFILTKIRRLGNPIHLLEQIQDKGTDFFYGQSAIAREQMQIALEALQSGDNESYEMFRKEIDKSRALNSAWHEQLKDISAAKQAYFRGRVEEAEHTVQRLEREQQEREEEYWRGVEQRGEEAWEKKRSFGR